MMSLRHLFPLAILLAASAAPTPAAEPRSSVSPVAAGSASDARYAAEIENAIAGDRLLQARIMVGRVPEAAASTQPMLRARALLELAEGQPRSALELASRVVAAFPDDTIALECAGAASLRLHEPQAETLLARTVSLAPERWRAWNMLGVVADRAGRWDAADAAYARALKLRPDDPTILNNLGYSLMLRGRPGDAARSLSRAVRLDPTNVAIANNLIVASALNGELPQLPANLTPAQQASLLNNAGYAFWLRGDVRQARDLLQRAIAISPTYYERAQHNLERLGGRG